jgi:hypothetical protein
LIAVFSVLCGVRLGFDPANKPLTAEVAERNAKVAENSEPQLES